MFICRNFLNVSLKSFSSNDVQQDKLSARANYQDSYHAFGGMVQIVTEKLLFS